MRIAIDFAAIESQRIVDSIEIDKAGDIAVEHQVVLGFQSFGAGQFLKEGIVDGELIGRAALARVGVGHGERDAEMLEGLRISGEKFPAGADDAIVIAVLRVGLDEARMERGGFFGLRKAGVEQVRSCEARARWK